jgi:DNA-binding transcriptional ArsR family regulator
MVGAKRRRELDKMTVEILEYRKSLIYTELYEEVNRQGEKKKPSSPIVDRAVPIGCKPEVQWKKPPNSTFDRRLKELEQRGILHKEYRGNNTYYSLTERFRYSLDKNKQEHPATYIERALHQFRDEQQPSRIRYTSELESDDDDKALEIIKPSENEESLEDKKI